MAERNPLRPARPLRAVILAAGSQSITADGQPLLLQRLGDAAIIDYVMANVRQIVAPEDTYIVVGYRGEDIRGHLGPSHHYVAQEMPRGTGDAVLRLQPLLKDYDGDLLILYGDTPLFSATSIRGLINRHRLREADLTLLTAVVDRPYPYGRVVRDRSGRILDIVEEVHAKGDIRDIRELNVGAYVVAARQIWPVLEALRPSPIDGDYRLTDSAHALIHYGSRVETTRSTTRTKSRGSTRPPTLCRPSSSCKNGSSGPGNRRSATSSVLAPAGGGR